MNIEEKNLDEIEFLLAQSMNGVHHLFDNQVIAKILQTPTEEIDFFNFENMDRIQELFTQLLNQNSVQEKKTFLQTLDENSYEILVRIYFHIVDNTLMTSDTLKH